MNHHQNDIDQISNKMRDDFDLMTECNIRNCVKFAQHYRNREKEIENDSSVQETTNNFIYFYVDLLNAMHCHFHHLYDAGLRVKMVDMGNVDDDKSHFDRELCIRNKVIR